MEVICRDKVEYCRQEVGKGAREGVNRRESVISRTSLSSSCGQIGDERSRDMTGLKKHGNLAVVTHASGLVMTWGISHSPLI